MNTVIIDGFVQDEPRINTNQQTGNSIVQITIGNQSYDGKDQNGDSIKNTGYFYCKAFGYMAKWVMNVHKDDKVIIRGQLRQERWIDKNENKHSAVVIYIDELQYLEKPNQSYT